LRAPAARTARFAKCELLILIGWPPVLGMLGSAHDGEVIAAAARAAERLRRQTGKTWTELLLDQGQLPLVRPPPAPRPAPAPAQPRPGPRPWADLAARCLQTGRVKKQFEVQFLGVTLGYAGPPSARQSEILQEIARKTAAR
jgi:hypothetical protein